MKFIAETKEDFMLVDMSTGCVIPANRPAVISVSAFVEARVALHQVVKVADAPDEATDEDFAAFWRDSDGNSELAVSAFLSQFSAEPAEKKKRGK